MDCTRIFVPVGNVACSDAMFALQKQLFSNHSVYVRPVIMEQNVVNITLTMIVENILEMVGENNRRYLSRRHRRRHY
jgi:hypothetical protein